MASTHPDRSDLGRKLADRGIGVARLLGIAVVITALAAGALIAFITISAPLEPTVRIAAYGGIVVFGWCSISFLLGAVIAAASVA